MNIICSVDIYSFSDIQKKIGSERVNENPIKNTANNLFLNYFQ